MKTFIKSIVVSLFTLATFNAAVAQDYIADGSEPSRTNTVTIKKNFVKPAVAKKSLDTFAPETVADTSRKVEDLVIDRVAATSETANSSEAASTKTEAAVAESKSATNRNYTKAVISEKRTVSPDLKNSEYKSIVKDNSDILKADPRNEDALLVRAAALVELKDLKGAIIDFNEVIRINPENTTAYYNRGLAKMALGDFHGGISDMTKTIKNNPGDVQAYYNRAMCKSYLDKSIEAIDDLTVVIKLDPENVDAYLDRGNLKYDLEDTKGACRDWEAVASRDERAAKALKRYCSNK